MQALNTSTSMRIYIEGGEKMKNIGYKKGVVFVIIVVMLLIVPSTLATFNLTVVKTIKNNTGEDLPDLVILDIKKGSDYKDWILNAVVLNDGDGEVPGGTDRTLKCTVFSPILPIKVLEHTYPITGGTHPILPGEISSSFRLGICKPSDPPGIYKVYFKVDPDNAIDESNENNNVVWAYYIFHWIYVRTPLTRLTPLQQVSKIPGSMPLNIP